MTIVNVMSWRETGDITVCRHGFCYSNLQRSEKNACKTRQDKTRQDIYYHNIANTISWPAVSKKTLVEGCQINSITNQILQIISKKQRKRKKEICVMNSKVLFNATCWSILGDVSMIIALLRQFGYPLLKSRGTGLLSQTDLKTDFLKVDVLEYPCHTAKDVIEIVLWPGKLIWINWQRAF